MLSLGASIASHGVSGRFGAGVASRWWGKCTPSADSICNWLESASLEGMLEYRGKERERECTWRGVTEGEGESAQSRHIGQCRDTPVHCLARLTY